MPEVPERGFESYDIEAAYFSTAVESVKQQMREQEKNAQSKVGDSHSGIFEAHVMLLTDPELERTVLNQLEQSVIVEQAWMSAITDLAAAYAQSESQYLKEREADVWDVGRQLMVELCGVQSVGFAVDKPSIIIAQDLSPSDTAKLDPEKVLGICLSGGGKTSHSAILARAMGIPALVKVQGLDKLTENQQVTIDGFGGLLWLTPDQETKDKLEEKRFGWLDQTKKQLENANKPAVTLDGIKVDVLANIGGLEDIAGLEFQSSYFFPPIFL